jgi:translation initiation factor IF-2
MASKKDLLDRMQKSSRPVVRRRRGEAPTAETKKEDTDTRVSRGRRSVVRRRRPAPEQPAAAKPAATAPVQAEAAPARAVRRRRPASAPAAEVKTPAAPVIPTKAAPPAPAPAPEPAAEKPVQAAPAPAAAPKPAPAPEAKPAPVAAAPEPVKAASEPKPEAAPAKPAPAAEAKPAPEPKPAPAATPAPEAKPVAAAAKPEPVAAKPESEPAAKPAPKPAAQKPPASKLQRPARPGEVRRDAARTAREGGRPPIQRGPRLPGLGSAVVRPPPGYDPTNPEAFRRRVEAQRARPAGAAPARPAAKPTQGANEGGAGGRDAGRGRKPRGRGRRVTERRMEQVRTRRPKKRGRKGAPKAPSPRPKAQKRKVMVDNTISVKQLAHEMGEKVGLLIKALMGLDMMVTMNEQLDFETAQMVAEEFEYECVNVGFQEGDHFIEEVAAEVEEGAEVRPPVVTIMGHVDHGKTSLLDKIRRADVAAGEAGGITQHIGAYQVERKGERITFIDTPGHAAFTEMRARGANATDIVILVVAADDGVMPQTIESINHTKAAGVPIIVAVNKCDKPGANPDTVRQALLEYELVSEEFGGDTMMVNVSAITGQGIDDLLDAILLTAEVSELSAVVDRHAEGVVLEARVERGRGAVATILVRKGTLKAKDPVVLGTVAGRVRAMQDHNGKRLKTAGPSTPVELIGLTGVPAAGDIFTVVKSDKAAKALAEHRALDERKAELNKSKRMTLEELFQRREDGELKKLNLIVRGDVMGSLEAVKHSIADINVDGTDINILHAAVGAVSESDITLASTYEAIVVGFNVRPDAKARRAAESKGVEVRHYRVIYELLDDLKLALVGMLEPITEERVQGHAEVRATFVVPKVGTIAGCFVTDGKVARGHHVRLLRQGIVVYDGKLSSLKRFKDDVREVEKGYECGMGLENYNDLKVGDELETYSIEQVARTV